MQTLTLSTPITIRQSDEADTATLGRLAELDSARPIAGPAVIAEYGGRAVAAVTLDGERVIADPFESTQGVLELLRSWAGELRAA